MMAKASEVHKHNLTSVQKCWGKTFEGAGFTCTPGVIRYDDFEVGKKYKVEVTVTNVSLTFNQFKLQ